MAREELALIAKVARHDSCDFIGFYSFRVFKDRIQRSFMWLLIVGKLDFTQPQLKGVKIWVLACE
mgnify:CR=1 FL=1